MSQPGAWVTGPSVAHEGLYAYTHLIRAPSDPERSPRPEGGRQDRAPHRTLAKRPISELEALLLSGLEDGEPRTFNRLGVEIFDLTADVLFTTPVNTALWQLVEAGRLEHTLKAPIMFRLREKGDSSMEDQDQDQQHQDQEGEDLLKALGIEDTEKEDEEKEDDTAPLLSLTEISKRTGIMYVTLKRYAVLHDSTDLAGLWIGEGRSKKYHPDAIAVFQRLKAESRRGRPRGGAPSRGGVEDPLPPTVVKGKKGAKKGYRVMIRPAPAKGAKKSSKKQVRGVRTESLTTAPAAISTALSTQEADRAMAAIERVQLMARYEAVKEVVAPLLREMQRLEVVLGMGEERGL